MKRILTVITMLAALLQISARQISPDEALETANRFVRGNSRLRALSQAQMKLAYVKTEGSQNRLYVFNASTGGFVIVSGSDATEQVLGYGTSGAFDAQNMAPGLADMLDINLAIKVKQKEEKARIREEKRRLKEQEQLLSDIARERAKLLEEKKAMNIAFDKALTDDERNRIKSQLTNIDKRLDSIAYRESHSKAGWLYVITSPSLPGLTKIGCTRRLNPSIRIKELSSSSLPEPFHAHCFVFSDDCFELENNIHKYFDKERVNPDREFFRIEPKEAIDALKEIFNVDVHFVDEDCDENEEDE